jgi:hypothetical protein
MIVLSIINFDLLILLLFQFLKTNGKFIYVDSLANPSGTNCGTETNPCKTLGSALSPNIASFGDVLLVKSGIYTGPGNDNLCSSSFPCPYNFTIQRNGLGRVIVSSATQSIGAMTLVNSSYVSLIDLEFTGFTYPYIDSIPNGLKQENLPNCGAVIMATTVNLYLLRVIFYSNTAVQGGAIKLSMDSNATIDSCDFHNNTAYLIGGGLFVESSSLTLMNSVFNVNQVQPPITSSSVFSNIDFYGGGGAIGVVNELKNRLLLQSSNFSYNFAPRIGGALSVITAATAGLGVEASQLRFWGNSATSTTNCQYSTPCDAQGGAIYLNAASALLSSCIFYNNSVSTSLSNTVSHIVQRIF